MTFSFNLIDQPWIPVIRSNGLPDEVGLRELLREAPNLRAIACETPLMNASIMPVVLALLHRVFGPKDRAAWKTLWNAGAFPQDELDAYFAYWYERFDLFHPERPFYQVHDERVKPKSALYLAESIANSETLFDHRTEETFSSLTPAESTRKLLFAQFFRLGGGITGKETPNLIDGAFAKGNVFFANGETLFETFMLNMMLYPAESVMTHTPDDQPIWEQDDLLQGFKPRKQILNLAAKGYLDFLTWQTFHVRLVPEYDSKGRLVVTGSVVIPVARLIDETSLKNPFKALRRSSREDDWGIFGYSLEKALWRDYHVFLPIHDDIQPPYLLDWLLNLSERDMIDRAVSFQLSATAIVRERGKAAKALAYRHEQMPLPPAVLRDADAAYHVSHAIQQAEETARVLREALNVLAEHVLMRGGERQPDKGDRRNLVEQWGSVSLYWERLEPEFWEFLQMLSQGNENALEWWLDVLQQVARVGLEDAARSSGTSAPALKGQVMAERRLRSKLKQLLES